MRPYVVPNLQHLPRCKWTHLAYRGHDGDHWVEDSDAPFSIEMAHQLEHDALIFMAQKHEPTRTVLVVMRRG